MCVKCTLAAYQGVFVKWTDCTHFLTTSIHLKYGQKNWLTLCWWNEVHGLGICPFTLTSEDIIDWIYLTYSSNSAVLWLTLTVPTVSCCSSRPLVCIPGAASWFISSPPESLPCQSVFCSLVNSLRVILLSSTLLRKLHLLSLAQRVKYSL